MLRLAMDDGWLLVADSTDGLRLRKKMRQSLSPKCVRCAFVWRLVPIMGFGLVYSVHKYGGCWRYYTLHMVDRYSNLVDTTLLHHDFALDI